MSSTLHSASWHHQREERVEELLDDCEHEELVRLSEKAKDPKVVSIREQFEKQGRISDKQAAVLAGWIAEEQMEYGEED